MAKYYISIEIDNLVLCEDTRWTEPVGIPNDYESFELVSLKFCLNGVIFGFFDKNIISTEIDLDIKSDKELTIRGKVQGAFTVKSKYKDNYNDDYFINPPKLVTLEIELEFSGGKTLKLLAEDWDGMESSGVSCTFYKTKKDLNSNVAMNRKQ